MNVSIEALVGKIISKLSGFEKESECVVIETMCGKKYTFLHYQDCCENVYLADFECDTEKGATIISAEEVISEDEGTYESATWTFYKLETTKGEIWMRWLGESNGYYSESVDIEESNIN